MDIDPQRVAAIVEAALALPTREDREAYLAEACAGNPRLRQEVESRLAGQAAPTSELVRKVGSGAESTEQAPTQPTATRAGTRLGPYKLLQQLGAGGMGEVWLAEQEEPVRRRVALKIIKAGMDSAQVIARFEQERQALAMMDHPNIAKVLDGGTTETGRPYFVMELVKGIPITVYCDQEHLTSRERLELFIPVCQAVQHAHQKGIIHRDLKPSNVLVALYDGQGVPKIIDFGVAKATSQRLTERTMCTAVGSIVGTLEYMAPEQAEVNNLDIDTRADIYSLGVMLYELLTGTPPFSSQELRSAAFAEMLRIVREVEPPKPSTRVSSSAELPAIAASRREEPGRLSKLLQGDLDWIVMKCLEKDRSRRYETANQLGQEIQRYLADEPVQAGPPSVAYRLRKFMRRNRGPVIAAGLVLLVLVGGFVGTTWGLIQAEHQRQIALSNEREADRARTEAEERAKAEEQAKKLAQAEAARAEQEKTRADGKATETRHALYATRQQVAMNAWRENHADVLAEVIQQQKPAAGEQDLRGFEWSYLDRLSRSPGRRWQQSGQMVNGAAISPDDRIAITVGFDGKASAWDVATGRKKWDTDTAFRWSVNAAAISPDGKTIALAGHLGQLQLWNIDGTFRKKLEGHRAQVFGVTFSPDGKTLSSASADLSVRLWDVAAGTSTGVLGGAPEDEKGPPGPRAIAQTNPTESVGHTNMVWQTAWAPDGRRLASCSTDGSIKIWAMPDKRLLRTLVGHEGLVAAVSWSPDGRLVAGASRPTFDGSGGEVKLWNPDTGRVEATFRPPTGGLHALAFSPDGLYLVTAGQDRTVRVWRKDGRLIVEHRGFRDEVVALAVGGGGRWAVAGTRGGEVVAFELGAAPGKKSLAASDRTRLALAADGRLVVFRQGAVHWHDPETLAETASWPAARVPATKESDMIISDSVAFALRPDGQAAHSGHTYIGPGTVVWLDAAGKVRHLLSGHAAPITAVAFLSGDRLASADEAGAVQIWNGATGKATTNVQPWDGPVRFLVATGDGRLWAGGVPWAPGSQPGFRRPTSKAGRLARIEDGRVAWETAAQSVPLAADLSPDGHTLVVGRDDGTVLWLDARTGTETRRRSSATGAMISLRFSPDQRRIAVGGADGAVRLLDADSGEELLVLESEAAPATSVAFFSDGQRLAAACTTAMRGGTVVVWDGRPAGDPPPLPAPDAAWHKAHLAVAADSGQVRYGPRTKDAFAMRHHLNPLVAFEPNELQWPRNLLALDQDAGDFRAAAARLDNIVRRWPNDASMWYDLGNARRELGEVAGAEAAFRKCITLDPGRAEAHCNLGLLLGREGRFPEAIEFLSSGHELGMALKKGGKDWNYPSAVWLAHHKRLGDIATQHGAQKDFSQIPEADRSDLIEALTLTKRPLAAVRLADPKPEKSPGPTVIGAALRCAEGIGDADSLAPTDRSSWRAKALAWLRLDYESFRPLAPSERSRRCMGMQSHPLLRIAQGDRLGAWPAAERDAWQRFWADVAAAAEDR